MDEDEAPFASDDEQKDMADVEMGVDETMNDGFPLNEDKEEIGPDETIPEAAVGKGLSGALKLLKERGHSKKPLSWEVETWTGKRASL